jgi:hypothetical protein
MYSYAYFGEPIRNRFGNGSGNGSDSNAIVDDVMATLSAMASENALKSGCKLRWLRRGAFKIHANHYHFV